MLGRAVSFPIMFTVSFSFLAPCAFMQNIKRVDYWTTALLLTAVAVAGDLIVRQGPAGRSGNSVRYKWPDSDAETCPSPLELSTPKPRQERKNCNEKKEHMPRDNADGRPASGARHCWSGPTYDCS